MFPRNFPVDRKAANLLRTCYWETGVMDFGPKDGKQAVKILKYRNPYSSDFHTEFSLRHVIEPENPFPT